MRLQEIMRTEVEKIEAERPLEEAWSIFARRRIHHLVVTRNGSVEGILSERDCGGRRAEMLDKGKRVADVMTRRVVTATPDTTIRKAANLLRGHAVGCLPIVEKGRLKGIVTFTDLLELLGRGTIVPPRSSEKQGVRYLHARKKPLPRNRSA
ncbi:MAG: signal transduction protein [Planctomycetota bacterium]